MNCPLCGEPVTAPPCSMNSDGAHHTTHPHNMSNNTRDSWFDEFVAVRNKALATLDLYFARSMIPDCTDEETLLAALHKARFEVPDMPDALRHESRRWLESRGLGRLRNIPWPEGDALPDREGNVL